MFARRLVKDSNFISYVGGFEGVICDEAHQVSAETYNRVLQMLVRAYYRIGLSATPLARGDRKSVITVAALGPVIYKVPVQMMIDRGALAKPSIVMTRFQHDTRANTTQGQYNDLIVKNTKRNKLVQQLVAGAAKPCLVFVKQKKHGQILLKRLQKVYGDKIKFVWGAHSPEVRRKRLDELENGTLSVLICSVIFHQGIDAPEIRSIVVAGSGRSKIATLQRIGRGMRITEDKKIFEVWDILDEGKLLEVLEVLGDEYVQDTKNHGPHQQARARMRAYSKEGYEVDIVEAS
jgi:superfamily II DNA or RNA helicase